jgi:ACR3 family arsenite transporter
MRSGNIISVLLPLSILLGLGIGSLLPTAADSFSPFIDPLVLSLLAVLFFEVRFDTLHDASSHFGFLLVAWVSNFILIPFIGWGVATLFFGGQPALFAGLLLYLLFPCTDWFLAFTRIAKGDVALGAVLIPINLISQLLLFPIYLALFIGSHSRFAHVEMWGTFVQWFLFPFFGVILFRLLISRILRASRFLSIQQLAGSIVPWVLSALVFCIFSSHASQITAHPTVFPFILMAVSLFFILSWLLGELLAWRFRLNRPQYVLLAMTTTARNSPLMLGLATIALPDQPLVYAALIIGMLIEFPHLTVLSRFLLRSEKRILTAGSNPVTTR